jgi:hypothetical protein
VTTKQFGSEKTRDTARQAYGSGSIKKRGPGVYRLRVMVDGKQVERTFRGTEAAARKELRKLDLKPAEPKAAFARSVTCWTSGRRSGGPVSVGPRHYTRTPGRLTGASARISETSRSQS